MIHAIEGDRTVGEKHGQQSPITGLARIPDA